MQAAPHHIVHWPLSVTEAAVEGVPSCLGDIMAGAREQQLRAVNDDHVTGPVDQTSPPTALHLQSGAQWKG